MSTLKTSYVVSGCEAMLYTVFSGQWLSGLGYQRDHLVHVKTGLGLPTGTRLKKKKKITTSLHAQPVFKEQVCSTVL